MTVASTLKLKDLTAYVSKQRRLFLFVMIVNVSKKGKYKT